MAHGEYMAWYQSLGFTKDFVSKAVRVADELSNFETSRSLGIEALALIATLPPEQREQAHTLASGETKTVDEMTVRELREVKAKERYTVTQFGNSPECPDLETPNEAGATNEILATKAGVGKSNIAYLLAVKRGEEPPRYSKFGQTGNRSSNKRNTSNESWGNFRSI